MNKQQIKTIEAEIEQLSQQRATLFNEWISTVKQNDRDVELYGQDKPEQVEKANTLLIQQRQINQKIMQLLAKLDNIVLKTV
jgi:septal ring factor EnvC (AmiA/AmiB activator)